MAMNRWGGLACAECGSNDLSFRVGYTGADWTCEAGEKSGFGWEVMLSCDKCGRVYHICNCKKESDVSPVKKLKA